MTAITAVRTHPESMPRTPSDEAVREVPLADAVARPEKNGPRIKDVIDSLYKPKPKEE